MSLLGSCMHTLIKEKEEMPYKEKEFNVIELANHKEFMNLYMKNFNFIS